MKDFYFDRKGRPISDEEYHQLMQKDDYRVLKRTEFPDKSYVSTVWLGFDHGPGLGRRPFLFESMYFPDLVCWRSSTEKQAYLAHKNMVDRIHSALKKGEKVKDVL